METMTVGTFEKLARYKAAIGQGPIDFMIIGAQKSGTTTLDSVLRQHPGVGMPDIKELHFFDRETLPRLGRRMRFKYHRCWPPSARGKVRGEITPSYIFLPNCLERIVDYNPEIRVVAIFRDPVERAYSHWQMSCRVGAESLPFRDAILAEERRLNIGAISGLRDLSYLSRSRYAPQIRKCQKLFGPERTLFLRFEDLTISPKKVCQELFTHIGAQKDYDVSIPHSNRGGGSPISYDDWLLACDMLASDTQEALSLLQWDAKKWASAKCP